MWALGAPSRSAITSPAPITRCRPAARPCSPTRFWSSVICYTPEGLLSDAPATQRLAEAEGLWAHALSAALRRRVLEQGEDAVSAESLAAADLTKVAWPGDTTATVAEGVDLAAAAGATGEAA